MSKIRDNFVRLAEKRTRRTIKDIRLIGNLSNRSNYAYDEKDVEKIFSALERELRDARQRFTVESHRSEEIEFKLK